MSRRELVRRCLVAAASGLLVALAVFTTVLKPGESSFLVFSAVVAGCYALAALVTADGLPLAWRVALGSPAVVLFAWGVVLPIVL